MTRPLLLAALTAGALTACADLAMEPARTPTSITLAHDTVTLTEGSSTTIEVTVLDQDGEELDIPSWAPPSWSTSSTAIAASEGTLLNALAPGQTKATVEVAGLSAASILRVNPAEITLEVDSVTLHQQGSPATILVEGQEAEVRVYLHADEPNFFEPLVEVNVRRNGEVIGTFELTSESTSIPHQASVREAWTGALPASMVQQGNVLEVVVDPAGELPHTTASDRRHPADGYIALRFAVTIRIERINLTQSIQRADGSIPLVAGRDALLRVFATSDDEIALRPTVRATFYRDRTEVASYDIQRTEMSLPAVVERGILSDSWNVLVPGSLLAPGTSVVIEADPAGALVLTPESMRRFPASGSAALDIHDVPTLWVRMIPVHDAVFNTIGNITGSSLRYYTEPLLEKFPIARSNIDIRAGYTTYAQLDTFDGWIQLLREIEALRDVDGSGRYYYGVLSHPGGEGTPGGLGYIGWPAAIGYDFLPYGGETFAHELGHNFGLPHAPCGGPAGPDPDFPYLDGGIGEWGYDLDDGVLIDPADVKDLMSYCDPVWISDYNYLKVLEFRDVWDWTSTGPDRPGADEPALLIWGGVRNDRLVLEPAFELTMVPDLPSEAGPYRIEGLDALGNILFSYSFKPKEVDHGEGDANFSFAIPTRLARTDRLSDLRVVGPEGVATRSRRQDPPIARRPTMALQQGADWATLAWSAVEYPMALIRDARTGEVLSFARGGQARIATSSRPVEILLSDGVRTIRPEIR